MLFKDLRGMHNMESNCSSRVSGNEGFDSLKRNRPGTPIYKVAAVLQKKKKRNKSKRR